MEFKVPDAKARGGTVQSIHIAWSRVLSTVVVRLKDDTTSYTTYYVASTLICTAPIIPTVPPVMYLS